MDRGHNKTYSKEIMSKELNKHTLESFEHLKKSIDDLGVAVTIESDEGRMVIDATLHRAKVAFEVFGSLLEELAKLSGEDIKTPQDAVVAPEISAGFTMKKSGLALLVTVPKFQKRLKMKMPTKFTIAFLATTKKLRLPTIY